MEPHKKNHDQIKIFISLILLAILYFIFGNSKGDHFKKVSTFLKKEDKLITREHKAAHSFLEVQKIKNRNVYKNAEEANSDPDDFVLPKTPYGVSLDDENFAKKVNKDLRQIENNSQIRRRSPEYSLSKEITDDLYIDEREYETQQAYIEAFIDNAKKAGFEVELNENLEVVDVRRILKKQPLRFPQSQRSQVSKIKGAN